MAYGYFKRLTRRKASEYCMIKHLILLKIQNMIDVEGVLFEWFVKFFLTKKLMVVLLKG